MNNKKNATSGLVAKLLSPVEVAMVSGGEYAKSTPDYCSYSQSRNDPNYTQKCEQPKEDEVAMA